MNNCFIRFKRLELKFYAMLSQKDAESIVLLFLGKKREVFFCIIALVFDDH